MWSGIFSKLAGIVIALSVSAAAAENLRSQVDTGRDRVWVLTPAGVAVYDLKSGFFKAPRAVIALPGWHWAGKPYGYSPDLAIGPAGEVVVSSDVMPTLWRIDGVTLKVSRHELVLDRDSDKDVGFSGLTYSALHGAFFAVSHSHGTLWRVDPLLRRAQKIPLSALLTGASGLSLQPRGVNQKSLRLSGFCARTAEGDRAIYLAPDQRWGYVFAQACAIEPA